MNSCNCICMRENHFFGNYTNQVPVEKVAYSDTAYLSDVTEWGFITICKV